MTASQVEPYALRFDIARRRFRLFYTLAGDALPTAVPYARSPQEFCALADMVRNERPIFFSPDQRSFTTVAEPVGEGEAAPSTQRAGGGWPAAGQRRPRDQVTSDSWRGLRTESSGATTVSARA